VVWVQQVLRGGALEFGWLMSAQAVGGLVGGLVIGYLGSRFAPVHLTGWGMVLFGLIDIVLFTYPLFFSGLAPGLALIALVGIPASAAMSGSMTLLQTSADDEFRGRIFGTLNTTSALLRLVGTLLAGFLGAVLGPILMLDVMQGGSYLLAGVLALLLLPRAVRHASRIRSSPVETYSTETRL
jgi:MFS family permease